MSHGFVGGTVSATVSGEGPPLVLLHSLLADHRSFDRVVGPLSDRFKVVVPELPGFGSSAAVAGALPAISARIGELVREVGGDQKPAVLGNGFGGFVALQMAIDHADLASRLVLADCGAAFSEPGRAAFRNMAAAAQAKGLEAVTDTAMRRLFAPDFQEANPELMAERRAAFLRTDLDVFRTACEALAGLDLRRDLHKVSVPVLVLVGELDEATPLPMSEELAASLPDARLVVLPACAHVPQLQDPAEFLAALDGFLR